MTPTRTHSRGSDHIGLVSRWKPGDPIGRRWLKRERTPPPPGGIDFAHAPAYPAANEVFTPEELAARIEKLAALHADAPDVGAIVCWACGRLAPLNSGYSAHCQGWVSRTLDYLGWPTLKELYCPECFARWGWPDLDGPVTPVGGAA